MGAVVVGYVPKPEGEAAVDQGIAEARLRDADADRRELPARRSRVRRRDVDRGPGSDLTGARGAAAGVRRSSTTCASWSRGFEPAEDLISIAEDSGADLIVIGLRRRTPVGKLILGSNAQRILLDAPCPVLAVKVG